MVKGPAPFDQGIFLMHLGKGKEYFEKGDFQKAREELEAAYHLRPQDEKVLNFLGMTYFKMEMLPQAEEMYVALASNNPDIYTLQSNLGLIRLKLDKMEQAETALTRALELQPANPKAHFYLGLLYEKMENWHKALFHFDHAKADKMVARAKEKLAAAARSMQTQPAAATAGVLPFQVLEVLDDEETIVEESPMETIIAPIREALIPSEAPVPPPAPAETQQEEEVLKISEKEIAAAEREWVEHTATTGKMRRKDVLEAMKLLEEKETVEEPAEEEELVEDSDEDAQVPPVEEIIEEVVVQEEKPWEKTQPTLRAADEDQSSALVKTNPEFVPEQPATEPETEAGEHPEAAAQEPSNIANDFLGTIASGEGLFLPEETAADISHFLAQSRDEVDKEEAVEDFIDEPPVEEPPFPPPVFAAEEPEPAEPVFESRIPTPDEVENSTMDFGRESIFVTEEDEVFESEEDASEEDEDLEEPIPAESSLFESPFEDDDDEPETSESFADVASSSIGYSEPVKAPVEPVEHTMDMGPSADTEVPAQEAAEMHSPAQRDAAVVEGQQAANLDQFSRDRFYIQPLIGADRFLLIDPHLLEIIISNRMIVRKGTISSFTGRVNFTSWADEKMPLTEVSGSGILFLADRRKEVFLISLNNESIYVETNHLLAAQSNLKVEPFSLQHGDDVFSTVKVSGRGTIALTCSTKPLTLNVYETMPANIPADALIAWSGRLQTEVIADENMYRVMMQPDETGTLLRFSGAGDVVVEQGSLWGDRRAKK